MSLIRHHPFRVYVKFSEKLTVNPLMTCGPKRSYTHLRKLSNIYDGDICKVRLPILAAESSIIDIRQSYKYAYTI